MTYKTWIDRAMPIAKMIGGAGTILTLSSMLKGGAFSDAAKYGAYAIMIAGGALVVRGAQQFLYGGAN